MKEWILNVALTVFINALLLLVMPNGKTSKIIKSVMALILIIIILSPVLKLEKGDFVFNGFFSESEITYQEDYLIYCEQERKKEHEKVCLNIIETLGITINSNALNILTDNVADGVVEIQKITVNLKNAVIKTDKEHIDIKEEIIKTLSSYFYIDKTQVEVLYV